MNFYVISSFYNKEQVRDACKRLTDMGLTQLYDWTDEKETMPECDRSQKAAEEIEAAIQADLVLMLLPTRFGAHGELGAAIASATQRPNKKIIVWAENSEDMYYCNNWKRSIFFYHPSVDTVICSYDELFEYIARYLDSSTIYDKFIVFKKFDCYKYLNPDQLTNLEDIISTIKSKRTDEGRPPNKYYVINTDESYAGIVEDLIVKSNKGTEPSIIEKRKIQYLLDKLNLSSDSLDRIFQDIDSKIKLIESGNFYAYESSPYGLIEISASNLEILDKSNGLVRYKVLDKYFTDNVRNFIISKERLCI